MPTLTKRLRNSANQLWQFVCGFVPQTPVNCITLYDNRIHVRTVWCDLHFSRVVSSACSCAIKKQTGKQTSWFLVDKRLARTHRRRWIHWHLHIYYVEIQNAVTLPHPSITRWDSGHNKVDLEYLGYYVVYTEPPIVWWPRTWGNGNAATKTGEKFSCVVVYELLNKRFYLLMQTLWADAKQALIF